MEVIELLLKVQGIDLILGEIKAEHDTIPGQLEELDNRVRELEQAIAEREAELKELKVAVRNAESKTSMLDEMANKYKQQLVAVKTNREYSALLTEIESVKREKEEIDESTIAIMERMEAIAAEIQETRNKLEDFQTQSKESREELSNKIKTLREKMDIEKRKRDNLAVRIEKTTFKLYERIMNSRNDRAVVPLRNGSCGGCFAEVPLQKVADIRKGDRLLTCDDCGRILYYEER
jgi:predicted  nucleic acid-binding Zn-ribbon protein